MSMSVGLMMPPTRSPVTSIMVGFLAFLLTYARAGRRYIIAQALVLAAAALWQG